MMTTSRRNALANQTNAEKVNRYEDILFDLREPKVTLSPWKDDQKFVDLLAEVRELRPHIEEIAMSSSELNYKAALLLANDYAALAQHMANIHNPTQEQSSKQTAFEKKAFEFYELAHLNGSLYAQYELALCYATGKGCPIKPVLAQEIFLSILSMEPSLENPEKNQVINLMQDNTIKYLRANKSLAQFELYALFEKIEKRRRNQQPGLFKTIFGGKAPDQELLPLSGLKERSGPAV